MVADLALELEEGFNGGSGVVGFQEEVGKEVGGGVEIHGGLTACLETHGIEFIQEIEFNSLVWNQLIPWN